MTYGDFNTFHQTRVNGFVQSPTFIVSHFALLGLNPFAHYFKNHAIFWSNLFKDKKSQARNGLANLTQIARKGRHRLRERNK